MIQPPRVAAATLAATLLLAALPVAAHHTFVSKYDNSKLITVAGTVDSVSFGNPHIFFSVSGWTVETEGVAVANGKGLTRERLKEGAKVTVRGWKARDGSSAMGLQTITFAGGPSITMRGSAR
ncbi:MAG: DUF6152 family protein [Hyphomicrobium sp.]